MKTSRNFLVILIICFVAFTALLLYDAQNVSFAQVNTFDSGIITVPDSTTTVVSGTFILKSLHCSNNTGSAATLSITDSTPITYFPAVSMAANSVMVANYGEVGIKMSGFKWFQGTSGAIECQVAGKVN